jgi:hypothetical protein
MPATKRRQIKAGRWVQAILRRRGHLSVTDEELTAYFLSYERDARSPAHIASPYLEMEHIPTPNASAFP